MFLRRCLAVCTLFVGSSVALGQDLESLNWVEGPAVGKLGNVAQIQVPEGYLFLDGADTRVFMEAMENPTDGSEYGFIAPTHMEWFVVFEYMDVGYVKDDDKDSLDADAILASIRAGTAEANKERRARGWTTMEIVGWSLPPQYNPQTRNLEWAILGSAGPEDEVINHNTRYLGRSGVMSVALVADPQTYQPAVAEWNQLRNGFEFQAGQRYAEYREGDKLAGYGLTALMVGGATAVAAKSGAFKWIWKLLVFGVIAVAGVFRGIFSKLRGAA